MPEEVKERKRRLEKGKLFPLTMRTKNGLSYGFHKPENEAPENAQHIKTIMAQVTQNTGA